MFLKFSGYEEKYNKHTGICLCGAYYGYRSYLWRTQQGRYIKQGDIQTVYLSQISYLRKNVLPLHQSQCRWQDHKKTAPVKAKRAVFSKYMTSIIISLCTKPRPVVRYTGVYLCANITFYPFYCKWYVPKSTKTPQFTYKECPACFTTGRAKYKNNNHKAQIIRKIACFWDCLSRYYIRIRSPRSWLIRCRCNYFACNTRKIRKFYCWKNRSCSSNQWNLIRNRRIIRLR